MLNKTPYMATATDYTKYFVCACAMLVGFRFVNLHLQYAFLKSSKDFIN